MKVHRRRETEREREREREAERKRFKGRVERASSERESLRASGHVGDLVLQTARINAPGPV